MTRTKIAGGSLAGVLGLLLLAYASCAPGRDTPGASSQKLVVLAAASLSDALADIQETYRAQRAGEFAISYGASGTLAGQVKNGAPADVVIFAGTGPMEDLESAGLVETGTRTEIVVNRLVVIAASGTGAKASSLDEVAGEYRGRIAIGETMTVPAGQYAKSALEGSGHWGKIQPRLLPQLDVRAVAAAVAAGNAEFGFVYATDVAAVQGVEVVFEVPADAYPKVVYPAAVVTASRNRDGANSFLRYLRSEEAKALFEKHGFSPAQ